MLSSTVHKNNTKKSSIKNEKLHLKNAETPITKELVLAQLEDMGYPRDLLSKDVLETFVKELQMEMEQIVTADSETPIEFQSMESGPIEFKNNFHTIIKKDHVKSPQKSSFVYSEEGEEESIYYNESSIKRTDTLETSHMTDLMDRLESIDLSRVRSKVEQQKLNDQSILEEEEKYQDDFNDTYLLQEPSSSQFQDVSFIKRPGSGFIRPNTSLKPRKKHDPVSRYHQQQVIWSRDVFLKRSKSKMQHPAAGTLVQNDPIKKRHNLAAMRSHYVVPTSKSRRDIVWEIRNKMANP